MKELLGELKGFKEEVIRRFDHQDDAIKDLQKIPQLCAAHAVLLDTQGEEIVFLRAKVADKASKKALTQVSENNKAALKKVKNGGASMSLSQRATLYGTAAAVTIYLLATWFGWLP